MKKTTKKQTDRGSVIVMAVGVLTLLFMLGATYLIVAVGDQREATSIAVSAPLRKLALGMQTKVAAELVKDLYFNADVALSQYPFETATTALHGADSPSELVDRWLSSTHYENNVYRHATNLMPAQAWEDPRFNNVPAMAYSGAPISSDGRWLVDTDGDHLTDSVLVYTGVADARGQQFWTAVRVVDLCSMVNVNTAYKPSDTVPYGETIPGEPAPYNAARGNLISDVNIEAAELGLGINAAALHQARASAVTSLYTLYSYNNHYVACALNQVPIASPLLVYRPFCMDDALGLLWREYDTANVNYTLRGRIRSVLTAAGTTEANLVNRRPFLAAWSSSRRLPMSIANGTANYKSYPIPFAIDANQAVTDVVNGKTNLMQAYFNAIPRYAIGLTQFPPGPPDNAYMDRLRWKLAAQLAANHIDFADADGDITVINTNAHGGALKDENDAPLTVFGIERQPFITELFLKKHRDDPIATPKQYSAIELFNPYASAVSLSNYKLVVDVAVVAATFPATLATGGRLVIRNAPTAIPVAAGAVVVDAPELNLSKACKIVRQVTVGATTYDVVMGSASLDVADPASVDDVDYKVWQRDDNRPKARYSVARYHELTRTGDGAAHGHDYTSNSVQGGTASAATTNLGKANDFVGNNLAVIAPTPIYVRNGGFVNLGDLLRLYTVGPGEDKALDERLEMGAVGDVANGRLKTKGVPAIYLWVGGSGVYDGTTSTGWPNTPGTTPPMLPKAPPGCLVSRFFTVNSPAHDGIDNDFDSKADGTDPDVGGERAIYGVINVNTAPREVLSTLPYMTPVMLDAIVAYRNALAAQAGVIPCLASAGEVLVPLWGNDADAKSNDYPPNYKIADGKTSDDGLSVTAADTVKDDMAKVQALWSRWSNVLTTRSDSFAVYVTVMRFASNNTDLSAPTAVKRYVSILDRSQCNKRGQPVMTLMFSEMD